MPRSVPAALLVAAVLLLAGALATRADAAAEVDLRAECPDLRAEEVFRKEPRYGTSGEVINRYVRFTEFRRSAALVVGVGAYDRLTRLEAPAVDADRVRDFLVDGAGFDTVVTLKEGRASLDLIRCLMDTAFPELLGPNDRFLFYFSGHGTQRESGGGTIGYLPLKSSGPVAYHTMIDMDSVERWSSHLADTRHTLFVLDACFSGLAGQQRKSAEITRKRLELLKGPSHYLITAGSAKQESVASLKRWGGSLFTTALLEAAGGKGELGTADGVVSLKEMLKHVEDRIVGEAARDGTIRMSPQMSVLQANEGEFFFLTREYLNRRAGNPPETKLARGEPVETKGARAAGQVDLEPVERHGSVVSTTNVRAEPSTASARVAVLEGGAQVYVASKVKGQPWYRVERDGEPLGYVFEGRVRLDEDAGSSSGSRWSRDDLVVAAVPPVPGGVVTRGAGVAPAAGDPDPPYEPGDVFRDCAECPEMVVVPAGGFTMGSPEGEEGRGTYEGPQRRVTIARPFAVGRFEVTFAEWDACVAGGGCGGNKPDDRGWGRGRRPVINVSWHDARAYVAWLARKAGAPYRLLTEAEWEYVARAGTTTPFWTGATISTGQANYDGNYVYGSGRKGEYREKTVEVGTLPANPWGLHEVHGNVREWVEDCYKETYEGVPADGRAWTSSSCSGRVLRGGSWGYDPRILRAAFRGGNPPAGRGIYAGFRVARTFAP